MKLYKMTLDDIPYSPPSAPWAGELTLEDSIEDGTLKIWYYKKPTILSASTPSQIPEIKSDYHRALAVYATKMFHLVDDDQGLKEAFSAGVYNEPDREQGQHRNGNKIQELLRYQ